MGVAKFDDGIPDNPKFIKAGPVPSWLWFCGVLYCRRGLTDGFIPKAKVPSLVVGLTQPYKHASKLVDCGLWHVAIGGYSVNGYLEWNPSKDQVEAYRAADKDRKQEAKRKREESRSDSGRNAERNPAGIQTESNQPGPTRARATSLSVSLSTSKDEDLRDESAREGDESDRPPVWSPTRPSRSGLATNHPACHELAVSACGRGLCVPKFLIEREWLPQAQHDTASIRQFVEAVVQHLPSNFVGDDPLKFWRNKWLAAHGSQIETTRGRSRTDDTVDAAREHMRRFIEAEGGPHVAGTLES